VPAPQPEEIYERTRSEGRRRLERPLLELSATSLVGGFDIAFGVAAFGLVAGAVDTQTSEPIAQTAGAIAFGIGFVFVVVGRSELFTENFLIPVAALDRERRSLIKLGELWVATLVLNLVGGVLLALMLTAEGVLRSEAQAPLIRLADHLEELSTGPSFLSAVVAGALLTLMTWFVEGAARSMGVRIAMAWLVGALVALGTFNHAIVSTIEIVFGIRFGADVGYDSLFANLGIAVAGNLVGGLGLVTFARFAQAFGSDQGRG
jgi:formate/nitrite transporter FocA (FNT family)